MEKKYKEILKHIEECYKNNNFNMDYFEFYNSRKEKGEHRTGILKYGNEKFFLKVVDKSEYSDENFISSMIAPYFKIVKKYGELSLNNKIIILYAYKDTIHDNSFNTLRSIAYTYEEKERLIENFFDNIKSLMFKTSKLGYMDGSCKSDRWFWGRIKITGRASDYYQKNFVTLLKDIKKKLPEYYFEYSLFFKNIYQYLGEKRKTVYSYNHGDFHDFNFSLDGTFWDVDTFGYNPILNDFVIYYWHFYGREDAIIYYYSPWLASYLYDELSPNELKSIRNLKEKIIFKWYEDIEKLFLKYHLESNIYEEFLFKLFCRVFLIDDVFRYEDVLRIKIYLFFGYFLKNSNVNVKNLLFTNPILFKKEEISPCLRKTSN